MSQRLADSEQAGVNQVRGDHLDARLLEGEGTRLNDLVIDGDTDVLTHLFSPRRDQEGFQKAIGIGQIKEQAPAHGAILAAEASLRIHGLDEIAGVFLGNPVFDRYQHRVIAGRA